MYFEGSNSNVSYEDAIQYSEPKQLQKVYERKIREKLIAREENPSAAELDEIIFSAIVSDKIVDSLEKTLTECGYEEGVRDAIKEKLNSLPSEELLGVLSIPWELRKTRFQYYQEAIAKGEMTPESVINELNAEAKELGFTIGYHVSNKEVMPESRKDDPNQKSWSIKGYEMDDRDSKLMAYYSLDYKDLYRGKNAKYLYMVRAQIAPGTSHKIDGNNHWGRAPVLSIIDKLPIQKDELDRLVHEVEQKLIDSSANK